MPAASGVQRWPLPARIAACVEHAHELRKAARQQVLLARELRESSALLRQRNRDFREFLQENYLIAHGLQDDWLDRG